VENPDPFYFFLGRSHVVVVHFPIAALIMAGLIQLFRSRSDPRRNSTAAFACLAFGAVSAAIAAGLGWLYASLEPPGRSVERLLFLHRWTGVGTAVVATITLLASLSLRRSHGSATRLVYRLGLAASVGLVAVAGHFGGELVHGEGYLTAVFDRAPTPPRGAAPADDPPDGAAEASGGAVRPGAGLWARVQPILQTHCAECHGPRKQKGKLRLDPTGLNALFARGAGNDVILRGDPEGSELMRRVSLPIEDEDVMPAKGDLLTAAEIETLRAWIAAGAPYPEPQAPDGGSDAGESTGWALPPADEARTANALPRR